GASRAGLEWHRTRRRLAPQLALIRCGDCDPSVRLDWGRAVTTTANLRGRRPGIWLGTVEAPHQATAIGKAVRNSRLRRGGCMWSSNDSQCGEGKATPNAVAVGWYRAIPPVGVVRDSHRAPQSQRSLLGRP